MSLSGWMKPLWRRTKAPRAVALFDGLMESAATGPLPEMLTSLGIVAREIKNQELQQWADLELAGYLPENPAMTESVVVPEYRAVPGCWRDEYGRPLILEDPKLYFINETRLRHGVAELERLSRRSDTLTAQYPHGAEIIRRHLQVDVTWFQFSAGSIIGILAAIRAGLLDRLFQMRPSIDQLRVNSTRRGDLARLSEAAYLSDPTALHDHIHRIEMSIETDPSQAIGSAKELAETAAKHVLQQSGVDPDQYDTFPRLVKAAVAKLELGSEPIPDASKGAQALSMLTGGLGQIGEATATLRNLYGTGHGRTRTGGAKGRHARLVVGACSTLAAFLLETLHDRKASTR